MIEGSFPKFIESLSRDFIPVVDAKFSKAAYVPIDLSIHATNLKTLDVSSSSAFEAYIRKYVNIYGVKLAYGGYCEIRDIYRRSTHFNEKDPETERNIHLGIDIWCDAGTKVLAPLAGIVHSFKHNTNFGDYGPTIILEHNIQELTFYTLYGHLSMSSIANLEIGQYFERGSVLAILGDASVNGDYAPHLHFQIIKDLQGSKGDYPGVSNKRDIDFYVQNCPNPNLLLKI